MTLLDLCGGSGAWSKPYRDAGWEVTKIDTRDGWDVRMLEYRGVQVDGILAAPPCTVFANSGARWKRSQAEMIGGLSIVDACLRMVVLYRPRFWALENPVGTLGRYLGPPIYRFDPCDFGDPYTKRTCLWGEFTIPIRNPTQPVSGSVMHTRYGGKSRRTKILRSRTPDGFAKAFFEVNQ